MPAELQEIVALALVVLVAGIATYRRLRYGRRASCHGCGAGGCGSREPGDPAPSSRDQLTSIKLS